MTWHAGLALSGVDKHVSRQVLLTHLSWSQPLTSYESYMRPVCTTTLQHAHNRFVTEHPQLAHHINSVKMPGIGAGELITWFVGDNVTLGGQNSPCDFYIDQRPWAEAKSGPMAKGTISDFKLNRDGSLPVYNLLSALDAFANHHRELAGAPPPGWTSSHEVPRTVLRQWQGIRLSDLARSRTSISITYRNDAFYAGETRLGDLADATALRQRLNSFVPLIQPHLDTIKQIEGRWRTETAAMFQQDYVLYDRRSMLVSYHGPLLPSAIHLDRIHRGQPFVRVNLAPEASG